LFDLFMTPFSQELEPPRYPGRFMKYFQAEPIRYAACA
jgi:hypothetical protein